MNKEDMIGVLALRTGHTRKDVKEVLDALLETIAQCLRNDEEVSFYGFGGFETVTQKPRRAFDFGAGEVVDRPASKIVKFRPSPRILQEED